MGALISWLLCDRTAMSLANHAHDISGAIDDHGKEVHNIAAEHAHVEGLGLSEAGEGSLESDGGSAAKRQTNVRGNGHRGNYAAHAAKLMRSRQVWKAQCRQNRCGENRSVCSHIHEQLHGQLRTVRAKYFTFDHRADDTVITQRP